ncbi:hypothetical protein [Halobacillus sp. Cin3]|nr:hypothetical protein [Halobacillus sp. Cin3]
MQWAVGMVLISDTNAVAMVVFILGASAGAEIQRQEKRPFAVNGLQS